MRSWVSVEATIGTPVCADALATAMSPWKSCEHRPMTPIGHMNTGVGNVMSNSDTDRSRSVAPPSIRGTIAAWENASTLARWVPSSPQPPAT